MDTYQKIDAYLARLIEESTPECTVWDIERRRQGKPSNWNYIDGCMMTVLLEVAELTGDRRFFEFVDRFYDHFICEDGSILTYDLASYSLDNINEGRALIELYKKTGTEKYRKAIELLHTQLRDQPRTTDGNFWHKSYYPNQVWLDGLYMAQPFCVLYEQTFGDGDCSDTFRQFTNVRKNIFNEDKGLYYHGYEATHTVWWADPETGCSKNFWLRAMGWFSVALADLMELLPPSDGRRELSRIFAELMEGISRYADSDTGMYWQVVDQGGRKGNYLETSGSCMIAYAMLKGARLGCLEDKYREIGEKTFHGVIDRYLSFRNGTLNLGGICLVASLGQPDESPHIHDGSFEYYISEPVVENDAKGVAPFILCYTEIMRLARKKC